MGGFFFFYFFFISSHSSFGQHSDVFKYFEQQIKSENISCEEHRQPNCKRIILKTVFWVPYYCRTAQKSSIQLSFRNWPFPLHNWEYYSSFTLCKHEMVEPFLPRLTPSVLVDKFMINCMREAKENIAQLAWAYFA